MWGDGKHIFEDLFVEILIAGSRKCLCGVVLSREQRWCNGRERKRGFFQWTAGNLPSSCFSPVSKEGIKEQRADLNKSTEIINLPETRRGFQLKWHHFSTLRLKSSNVVRQRTGSVTTWCAGILSCEIQWKQMQDNMLFLPTNGFWVSCNPRGKKIFSLSQGSGNLSLEGWARVNPLLPGNGLDIC